jgi:N-methylhydantoinase A/oxoprolinase/acetone carboxylase beta subunit
VTDASMVLGYLNPGFFAGGQMSLDAAASRKAMEAMGQELGLSAAALASGMHRIINERMSDEIRLVSVRRGYDPRQFALVALGGAGPVHAGRLAAMLSIPTVVVPAAPGVLAAFGLLVSDIEHEHTRTYAERAEHVELADMEAVFAELDGLGREKMARDQVAPADIRVSRYGDLRYVGQSYELEVALPDPLDGDTVSRAVADFTRTHERVYGHAREGIPVEFVNLRTVHVAHQPDPRLEPPKGGGSLAQARKETRPAYFDEAGDYQDTPVYDRVLLPAQEPITGPAIIEQQDTTTVVYPGQVCRVDAAGNMLITLP